MSQTVELKVSNETQILNIRTGELPKPFNVSPLALSGNISAPQEYHKKRESQFAEDRRDCHVIFKKNPKSSTPITITLVQRAMQEDKVTVTGTLQLNPEYTEFGINSTKKYTIEGLIKFLKRQRPFFADVAAYEGILKKVQTFSAQTVTEFQQSNDYKGNIAFQKIQKCKTNLDYEFQLNLPIYEGGKKQIFNVNIEFEPADGSIVCWFDSPEAHILEIEERDMIYDEQLSYFQTLQLSIPVIES